jgi:hypothetical protein
VKDGFGVSEAARTYKFTKTTRYQRKVWCMVFMKRHHKVNLQQPELTSLATVSGFKKVHTIFDVLKYTVDEIKIACLRIFNVDKTSHAVVQHPEKIISQRQRSRWCHLIM